MRDLRRSWAYHEAVLEELSGERANALGRAGIRLNEALSHYRSMLQADADPTRVESALTEARDAAWALIVQRECAGFRSKDFTWLREHWDVPDEVLRRI